jgi:predicted nucleotidyltransferase component of viral defense system
VTGRGDLTPGQGLVLARLGGSDLAGQFYLTGGSALAAFYLHHRTSLDLDLFSRRPFDPKKVVRFVTSVADGPAVPHRAGERYEFTVPVAGERLRLEFVHYDFDSVAPSGIAHAGIPIDSLRDIAANKLSTIIERIEPKDFADLLFLLRRPDLSLEQAAEDCRRKFGWPGLGYLLQTALLRVERLSAWPETHPPTSLDEARRFFRDAARSLVRLDDE